MFEQSLVEISSETKRRKRWTALLSYSLEAAAVLVLLSFPLVHTEALPLDDSPRIPPPTRYVPPHVDIVTAQPQPAHPATRPVPINVFQQPGSIPKGISMKPDRAEPQEAGPVNFGPLDAIPTSDPRAQNRIIADVFKAVPVKPVPAVALPRVSRPMEGMLIRQVKPVYPPIAISTRVQGAVILQAVISRQGNIEQLQLVSGHPLLVNAALEAVRQWKYRPYMLNGDPVEVDTRITVNFTLNGN